MICQTKSELPLLNRFAAKGKDAWWLQDHEAIASDEAIGRRWMVGILRSFSKASQPVLFFGTRYAREVLAEGQLRYRLSGSVYEAISFTRLPTVAADNAYFYANEFEHEKVGAVLVFDRNKLNARYRLDPCDPPFGQGSYVYDEAEERIWRRDVTNVSSVLVGVVWTDGLITVADNTPTQIRVLDKRLRAKRSKKKAE